VLQGQEVTDRTVLEVDYDDQTSVLEVWLRSGAVYQYFVVPVDVADALATAPSADKYLASSVKGRYRRRRIR
jgi:hypothetical protein